ncbi:MAG: LacI family DNA-binding transcriptional regulator [Spirochaetales bacterium]|nr:LacI family DNA-binding transcriptional regulator [Spirochaetales bacterium]
MNVTIKDIANKLNMNFSSVSRALNNKPGVSDNTRKLVIRTAEEMGYHPNTLARGLVSRTNNTIGVIMPDIINPVFGTITTGLIETANNNDYDVFLCITNWNRKKEEDYIYTLLQKQVAGIIVKSVGDIDSPLFSSINIPLIGYESWSSTHHFSSVSTDNDKAGHIAGEHLIEYGYRKTAIFPGPENSFAGLIRCEGFYRACKDHDISPDKSRMFFGDYNIESGHKLASRLIKEFPDTDSILAGNDVIALGVLQYLEENNIKAGEDLGVVGFDNISFASLPHIELTTIKQQKYSIGRIMMNLLFEEINNKKQDIENFPQRILLEPELIVRSTTCKRI